MTQHREDYNIQINESVEGQYWELKDSSKRKDRDKRNKGVDKNINQYEGV